MLKKIAALVLCGAMLCGLTGCSFGRKEKEIDPKHSPNRYVDKVLQDMQDYLKESDANALYELFADYSGATVQEVQGLLNFIDGEIASFDENCLQPNGGTVKYGEYLEYAYGGQFNISTSSGKEYECHFAGYAVHDEKPEKVGLEWLAIINVEDEKDRYGVGPFYNEKGQKLDLDGNVIEKYLK